MYRYKIKPRLKRILKKLFKKDREAYERVMDKIEEVITSSDVEHYKNLRYNLKEFKRVQIGSFILIFRFDKSNKIIDFENYDHHDKIYR